MKYLIVITLFLFSTGCAQKIVSLVPLERQKQQQIQQEFYNFSQQQCPVAVDSDVVIHIDVPGDDLYASGMLMAQKPGNIHFRVTDPLGRAMMILVSDGSTFTFVDNRKSEGYIGSLHSESWTKYVHPRVDPEDLFNWLSGRLPEGSFKINAIGRVPEDECCWFVLDYNDTLEHHIRFDPETGKIQRHFLVEDSKIVFDVEYSYISEDTKDCLFPEQLQMKSSSFSGVVFLRYEKIYSHKSLASEKFKLSLPTHFTVYQLE